MAITQVDFADLDTDQIIAQHGPFVLLTAGVVVTGPVTYDEWLAATSWVQKVEKHSPFWIGDLLAYGEAAYGEKYAQVIEATGHKVQYLMNVASVAQQIPPERRHPDLSFSHHQEVAYLPEAEQNQWLDKAELDGLSVKDLRHQVRVSKAQAAGQTVQLGIWTSCTDLADQQTLYEQMVAAGRAAKKTAKEL